MQIDTCSCTFKMIYDLILNKCFLYVPKKIKWYIIIIMEMLLNCHIIYLSDWQIVIFYLLILLFEANICVSEVMFILLQTTGYCQIFMSTRTLSLQVMQYIFPLCLTAKKLVITILMDTVIDMIWLTVLHT